MSDIGVRGQESKYEDTTYRLQEVVKPDLGLLGLVQVLIEVPLQGS